MTKQLGRLVIFFGALAVTAVAQTPGVDPRGVMTHSPAVIVGIVEESWQKVIRPEKTRIPKANSTKRPDGTVMIDLPLLPRDYIVGYIYRVRVLEILKGDQHFKVDRIVKVFAPESLESGVYIPPRDKFVLALTQIVAVEEIFKGTAVSPVGDPITNPGRPFDVKGRYYQVPNRNGVVAVTERNAALVAEIRKLLQ